MELESLALQLVGQIYDAVADPDGWSLFLQSLSLAVGGAAIALALELARPNRDGWVVQVGHDPGAASLFSEYYWRLEPWLNRLRSFQVGEVIAGEALLDRAAVLQTEYYNDFMRPQNLHGSILAAMLAEEGGRPASTIGLHPMEDGKPLGAPEVALLEHLSPHLVRAVQVVRLVGQAEAERRGLRLALDRLPVAVLLLDRQGRLVTENQGAEDLLAEEDGLAVDSEGSLRASRLALTGELQKLVAEAAEASQGRGLGSGGVLSLPRPSGRRALHAVVTPLRAEALEDGPPGTLVAVFVTDPERKVDLPVDGLRRLYRLTPAEAALATRLADGASLDQVAEELGLTRNSARIYLKQVFAKTDTHRQGELVALLLKSLIPHAKA